MPSNITPFSQLSTFGDAQEKQCLDRIALQYNRALKEALKRYSAFFQKLEDVRNGVIQPPQYYVDQGAEAVLAWQNGFIHSLIRQSGMIEGIAEQFTETGKLIPNQLDDMLATIYKENFDSTARMIQHQARGNGMSISFHQLDKRQIPIILDAQRGAMTKIAYNRFVDTEGLQERLQNEMFQATVLGESQQQLTRRIKEQIAGNYKPDAIVRDPWIKGCRNLAQYEMRCAKRIAQTERTRVQSQARHQACQEAKQLGVGIANEWSARMVNTRETHADLNGWMVEQGTKFHLSDGDRLEFPGDPSGKACNVINCYCVMIPHVLLHNEYVSDGRIVRGKTTEKTVDFHEGILTFERGGIGYITAQQELPSVMKRYESVVGNDISKTYTKDKDTKYAIEDVVHKQGFDRLPHLVNRKEFDELLIENGIFMVRRYGADDNVTLSTYIDSLRSGKWYINCEYGEHALGRGMYTASVFDNKIRSDLLDSVSTYGTQAKYKIEQFTLVKNARIGYYDEIYHDYMASLVNSKTDKIVQLCKEFGISEESREKWLQWMQEIDGDKRNSILMQMRNDGEPVNRMSVKFGKIIEEAKQNDVFEGDIGAYAASLGYDAYTKDLSEQTGKELWYTVVLNRTALIILDE